MSKLRHYFTIGLISKHACILSKSIIEMKDKNCFWQEILFIQAFTKQRYILWRKQRLFNNNEWQELKACIELKKYFQLFVCKSISFSELTQKSKKLSSGKIKTKFQLNFFFCLFLQRNIGLVQRLKNWDKSREPNFIQQAMRFWANLWGAL